MLQIATYTYCTVAILQTSVKHCNAVITHANSTQHRIQSLAIVYVIARPSFPKWCVDHVFTNHLNQAYRQGGLLEPHFGLQKLSFESGSLVSLFLRSA